jgi:hypothetical protein
MVVGQGDCHIGIFDADIERNPEDAARCLFCDKRVSIPVRNDEDPNKSIEQRPKSQLRHG